MTTATTTTGATINYALQHARVIFGILAKSHAMVIWRRSRRQSAQRERAACDVAQDTQVVLATFPNELTTMDVVNKCRTPNLSRARARQSFMLMAQHRRRMSLALWRRLAGNRIMIRELERERETVRTRSI